MSNSFAVEQQGANLFWARFRASPDPRPEEAKEDAGCRYQASSKHRHTEMHVTRRLQLRLPSSCPFIQTETALARFTGLSLPI